MLLVLLILLALGFWAHEARREAQVVVDLTPETVVRAFQDAGYRISDVRETDDYPGPMALPEHGIRFNIHVNSTLFSVLVVSYDEQERARRSAIAINELDQRMGGGYAYAFYRGTVLIQIFPSDKRMGDELDAVLEAME